MCIHPAYLENTISLNSPITSSSYNLPTPSFMWISDPEEECDKDTPFRAEYSKVIFCMCCPVVGLYVNYHILHKETSLGGLSDSLIYGYSNTSLGDILLLCSLAI